MPQYHEPKNTRALNLIKTWLRESKITFSILRGPADLLVKSSKGEQVEVQIRASDSPEPPVSAIVLQAETITGRNIQAALDLFRVFIQNLGFEWHSPVNRGPLPTKKAYFNEDFEGGALRHADLHRCPNPDPAELAKYEPVMISACKRFKFRYHFACLDNMHDMDDLMSYARMWTIAYIGMYQAVNPSPEDNARKLSAHLRQRFQELRNLWEKAGKNIFAHFDEAQIAMTGTTFDYNNTFNAPTDFDNEYGRKQKREMIDLHVNPAITDESIDTEYVSRHCQLDTSSEHARRNSASLLLSNLLSKLPHDEMVEKLQYVISSNRTDPTARKEAAKILKAHGESCGCLASKETEESGFIDFASVPEQLDNSI